MPIAIIGNSGSGKSTLAQHFVAQHGYTALDLDTIAWEPGKVAVPRPPADAAINHRFSLINPKFIVSVINADLAPVSGFTAPKM